MSYESALEAAGATVHEFKEFGSYQGDWWAKVTHNGQTGWVQGSYGSCSGCDAFQAEFDYGNDQCSDHKYVWDAPKDCEACTALKNDKQAKLARFGEGYLDLMDQAEAEARAGSRWGDSEPEALQFIKDHAIKD